MDAQTQLSELLDGIEDIRRINFRRGYLRALVVLSNKLSKLKNLNTMEVFDVIGSLVENSEQILEEEFKDVPI